jgi:hypothetical protein
MSRCCLSNALTKSLVLALSLGARAQGYQRGANNIHDRRRTCSTRPPIDSATADSSVVLSA